MANNDIETREFPFKLKPEEVEQRKNKHLAVEREIDEETIAKKGEMAARNATLRVLRKDREALIEACTTGYEKREVDVREEWDFKTNRVVFKRVDTGDQIEERAMSGPERQEQMFDDDGEPAPELQTAKKKRGRKATTDKPTRARARNGKVEAVQ